jgi:protein TonB
MILNKLTTLPTLFRLTLCLITSAGIHGGVAFYDQASRPTVGQDNSSAVVVALIDTVDDPAMAIVGTPKNLEQQAAAAAEPHAQVSTLPAVPSPPPAVALSPANLTPDVVKSKSTTPVEEPAARVASAAPVCVETRQDFGGPPAEAELQSGEVVAQQQTGAEEQLAAAPEDSEMAGPSPGVLIEATPNYRNNPLPHYPFIARQRHWQGVVWLVVDVAANGSVDGVEVERSCGYRVLDRAASKTVQEWEFSPATQAGLPIESRVRIPVRFSLEES